MANDTVLLGLEGPINLNELAMAARRFSDLMTAITQEVGGGGRVRWVVSELHGGSMQVAAKGEVRRPSNLYYVERAARTYIEVGKNLQSGNVLKFPEKVRKPAELLHEMIERRNHPGRFENTEETAVILPFTRQATPEELITKAHGAIEGKIQTVSSRGNLHFTLYDVMNDRAISCYLDEGREEMLRDLWGKRVTVEGVLTRDAMTGRPLTIRQISKVSPLEPRFGTYRNALGASPWYLSEIKPEVAIRKVRDAG